MDAGELDIRPYRSGDETAIVDLFKAAFGHDVSAAHWRWKLKGSSSELENVWLALLDGEPVFHYAAIETRFRLAGRAARVMLSVDTMTKPGLRRRGLLLQIATAIYARWSAQGADFVLGLPNQNWGSRLAAFGGEMLFPLQWMVRPLQPQRLLARRLRLPALARARWLGRAWNRVLARPRAGHGLSVGPMAGVDAALDELWERCRDEVRWCAVRDRRWLQWRYLDCPSRDYRLLEARGGARLQGYAAYSVQRDAHGARAVLAEIFAPRAAAAVRGALLEETIRELVQQDVDTLAALAVPGSAQYAELLRAGFLPRRSFGVALIPLDMRLPLAAYRDRAHWHLSGADFDVV